MSQGIPYTTALNNKLQGRTRDNWSTNDLIVLAICLMLSVIIGMASATLAESAFTGLLIGAFAAWILWLVFIRRGSKSYGRGYRAYWIWVQSQKDHVWWESGNPKHPKQPKNLPAIQYLAAGNNASQRIALLHHRDKKCDQLYIRATGGAFAAEDVHGQNRLVAELDKVLSQVLSMTNLHAGAASVRVMAPANMAGVSEYVNQFGDPTVFAEGFFVEADPELSNWLREVNEGTLDVARNFNAADNWGLIVLTIKRRRRQWKKVEKGKATREQIYELPVFDLGHSLVDALQTSSLDLGEVHILEDHELFLLCRSSWDVYGIIDFYKKYSAIVREHGEDGNLMERLSSELSCWPERIIRSHGHDVVQFDDNFISVIRVEKTPELLRADVSLAVNYEASRGLWTRHYHGGEKISGSTETTQLMVEQAMRMNLEDAIFGKLLVRHPKLERKARDLKHRTDLVSSVTIAQLANEYWAVVASSPVEARRQYRKVMAILASYSYESSVVAFTALHVDAVLTATLGASRL